MKSESEICITILKPDKLIAKSASHVVNCFESKTDSSESVNDGVTEWLSWLLTNYRYYRLRLKDFLLEMITLTVVKSFVLILIHNANTSTILGTTTVIG